jgi:hypothetical protein
VKKRRRQRNRIAALAFLGAIFSIVRLIGACTESGTITPSPAEAGSVGPTAPPPSLGFSTTECRTCLGKQCPYEHRLCNAELGCANWLRCRDSCGANADGGVDYACADRCKPDPDDVASRSRRDDVLRCETGQLGGQCATCSPPDYREPNLLERCEGVVIPPLPTNDDGRRCPGQTTEGIVRCQKCAFERCCGTRAKCAGECSDLLKCYAEDCTRDADVEKACELKFPNGNAQLSDMLGCLGVRCLDECSDNAPDPCIKCSARLCPNENYAYTSNDQTSAYSDCGTRCKTTDIPCRLSCEARYSAAAKLLRELVACVSARCPAICGAE